MANYTPVTPTIDGVAPTVITPAGGGDTINNTSNNAMLRLINAGGASRTVTIAVASDQATRPAGSGYPATTYTNKAITVPATSTRVVGPITRLYTSSVGLVTLTYDATTSLTLEAWLPE
jgi:hypothetical protein